MTKNQLANNIYKISNITGTFKLRSGIISNEYFDKYLFEANPQIINQIAIKACKLLPKNIDCIAGLEMGGIPIATMISHYSKLSCLFIRKEAKEYGTCKYAEGGEVNNRRIVIIEDIVSTGGAIIDAVQKIRKDGGIVKDVICIIDRETGGRENLSKIGLNLNQLFYKSEIEKYITKKISQ